MRPRRQPGDALRDLLCEGYAPIRYRSRKKGGKPKRPYRPRVREKTKFGEHKRVTVTVRGHGEITFILVKNEAKAKELLEEAARHRVSLASYVYDVMNTRRLKWAKSFDHQPPDEANQ
jgi:hypothetical protein